MICAINQYHPMDVQTRLMNVLPYTIVYTNDLLTGRGGLVCVAELLRQIGFSGWVEQYFPGPGSNLTPEVGHCAAPAQFSGPLSLNNVSQTGKMLPGNPPPVSIARFEKNVLLRTSAIC